MVREPPALGVGAIVLAAGASERWGSAGPKALAPVDGRPAIARLGEVARAAGCAPVLAVVGSSDIPSALPIVSVFDRFLLNEAPEAGRTGSLRIGLEALPNGSAALIWPVDVPFVALETVRVLVRWARRESLAVWLTPTYDGHGGHPIVLTPSGVELARRLPRDLPLRDAGFRRGLGERRIAVEDPGVIDNTNYPSEFAAAEQAWRARGSDR